jgi:hypothetical protein
VLLAQADLHIAGSSRVHMKSTGTMIKRAHNRRQLVHDGLGSTAKAGSTRDGAP